MKQKIKQKLLNILPFWLIFLILTISVQNSLTLTNANKNSFVNNKQILGAETSIRGNKIIDQKLLEIPQISKPDFSNISAKSFLVFNLNSEQILAEKSSELKVPIASLTKLLTSLVAYEYTDLNYTISIQESDLNTVKPNLALIKGDKIKALDLFNSMLIGSSNDSATTLANFVSETTGKKFVDLMNSLAQNLKMNNSNFSNPIGFDSKFNYSTAEDLKKLITTTENLAAYTNLGRRTSYNFTSEKGNKYSIKATNRLLINYPEIEAIKTGFTEEAKGSMAVKININGKNIIFIVLASNNRESDILKLKDIITQNYNFN